LSSRLQARGQGEAEGKMEENKGIIVNIFIQLYMGKTPNWNQLGFGSIETK